MKPESQNTWTRRPLAPGVACKSKSNERSISASWRSISRTDLTTERRPGAWKWAGRKVFRCRAKANSAWSNALCSVRPVERMISGIVSPDSLRYSGRSRDSEDKAVPFSTISLAHERLQTRRRRGFERAEDDSRATVYKYVSPQRPRRRLHRSTRNPSCRGEYFEGRSGRLGISHFAGSAAHLRRPQKLPRFQSRDSFQSAWQAARPVLVTVLTRVARAARLPEGSHGQLRRRRAVQCRHRLSYGGRRTAAATDARCVTDRHPAGLRTPVCPPPNRRALQSPTMSVRV